MSRFVVAMFVGAIIAAAASTSASAWHCLPASCNFITPFDFFASSNTISVDIMSG